jgi:hypothetical protein
MGKSKIIILSLIIFMVVSKSSLCDAIQIDEVFGTIDSLRKEIREFASSRYENPEIAEKLSMLMDAENCISNFSGFYSCFRLADSLQKISTEYFRTYCRSDSTKNELIDKLLMMIKINSVIYMQSHIADLKNISFILPAKHQVKDIEGRVSLERKDTNEPIILNAKDCIDKAINLFESLIAEDKEILRNNLD